VSKYWVKVIHNDNTISTITLEFETEFPLSMKGMLIRAKKYSDTIKDIISYKELKSNPT
jgi:hypothetical protein